VFCHVALHSCYGRAGTAAEVSEAQNLEALPLTGSLQSP
jgi:hypothetical protein